MVDSVKELIETGRMFNIQSLLQDGFSEKIGQKKKQKGSKKAKCSISTKFNVFKPEAKFVEGSKNKTDGGDISLEVYSLIKILLEFSQGKSDIIWDFTSNFTPTISDVKHSDSIVEIIQAIMTGEQDSLTFKIQKLINIYLEHSHLDKEFKIGDFGDKNPFEDEIKQETSIDEEEETGEGESNKQVKEKVNLTQEGFR